MEIETVVIGIASVVNKADTGSVFIEEEVKRIGYKCGSGLGIDHPVNDGIIHGSASTMLPDAITVSVIGKGGDQIILGNGVQLSSVCPGKIDIFIQPPSNIARRIFYAETRLTLSKPFILYFFNKFVLR